jgi:hypothetical protein
MSLTGGNITTMAGRSYLIFADIEGKLDVLRVEGTTETAIAQGAMHAPTQTPTRR